MPVCMSEIPIVHNNDRSFFDLPQIWNVSHTSDNEVIFYVKPAAQMA